MEALAEKYPEVTLREIEMNIAIKDGGIPCVTATHPQHTTNTNTHAPHITHTGHTNHSTF